MGGELVRMIRLGAPAGWTALMRLVAETIADDARDPGQGGGDRPWSAIPVRGHHDDDKWRDGLTEQTGMSARAISRTLADLAEAGYEMREPLGKGKNGRVVFTAPGHAMRFRVPRLAPRPVPERSPDMATDHGPATTKDGDHAEPERSPDLAERSPDLARTVAISGDPSLPGLSQISPQAESIRSQQSPGRQRAKAKPAIEHDSSGTNDDGPRPASQTRDAPPDPQAAAFKIIRPFARKNGISTEAAAELHSQAATMLRGDTDADHIRAALPAWHESGEPPEALPEFVESPAEAETTP
jgi:hypothetical protein